MNNYLKPEIEKYYLKVIQRLRERKFKITQNISYDDQVFPYVARRTKLDIEKGIFSTTIFNFSHFQALDVDQLIKYSAQSHRYALSSTHSIRGLFYGIFCFPVAVVDMVNQDTITHIRGTAPPEHLAAFEMPVICDLEHNSLYYCEITPFWGDKYYDYMRLNIIEILSP
jgi:hypothetical protein